MGGHRAYRSQRAGRPVADCFRAKARQHSLLLLLLLLLLFACRSRHEDCRRGREAARLDQGRRRSHMRHLQKQQHLHHWHHRHPQDMSPGRRTRAGKKPRSAARNSHCASPGRRQRLRRRCPRWQAGSSEAARGRCARADPPRSARAAPVLCRGCAARDCCLAPQHDQGASQTANAPRSRIPSQRWEADGSCYEATTPPLPQSAAAPTLREPISHRASTLTARKKTMKARPRQSEGQAGCAGGAALPYKLRGIVRSVLPDTGPRRRGGHTH